jgi:riboflavin kinase/FMN adenylyltransferase
MLVHTNYETLEFIRPVVTLGVFDGVHRGHRILLEHVVNEARRRGGESAAVTFDPPPRLVLSQDHTGLSFLSTRDEKQKLIEAAGIEHLIIIPFTREISNLSAYDFVERILVGKIKVSHLVVGYDHHFGKGRQGDFKTIVRCGEKYGFGVEKMEEVKARQGIISSTVIREALLDGRLDDANDLLGYSYSLSGRVVSGRRLGRHLGFPTANIEPSDIYKLVPANGVYAVEVQLYGELFKGVMSIGFNPTVSNDRERRSIEVNIFDFDREIYGNEITVRFRYRLRDEKKFEDTVKLAEQMEADRQEAKRLLS